MSREHAITAAQTEVERTGRLGKVIDVTRSGYRTAIIIMDDGRNIAVNGFVALKLLKLLRRRAPWRKYP